MKSTDTFRAVLKTVHIGGTPLKPPPPHSSRLRACLCFFPITAPPPPHLGKTDGPFHGLLSLFHIISIPFLGNFSQLTPYRGKLWVTPITFLSVFFSFLGLRKYVRILPLPSGAVPLNIRALPPILGRLLKAWETYPFSLISRESSEGNIPYLGRLV